MYKAMFPQSKVIKGRTIQLAIIIIIIIFKSGTSRSVKHHTKALCLVLKHKATGVITSVDYTYVTGNLQLNKWETKGFKRGRGLSFKQCFRTAKCPMSHPPVWRTIGE